MKNNQNGFSIIEVLAVLVIISIILVPLMSSFSGALELNDRSQQRLSATSVADSTLYGLEKIDYDDFRGKLDTANSNNDFYIEINEDNCNTLISTADQYVCNQIFTTIWNNTSYSSATYKVFMFDYSLTTAEHTSLINNVLIPESVREKIEFDEDILASRNGTDLSTLIRVVVWIDFYDDPDLYMILTGLIADE